MFVKKDIKVRGNEIITHCPKCSGEFKLYTNHQKHVFNCFRCGYSGRLTSTVLNKEIPFKESKETKITPLPEFKTPIMASDRALAYLKKRNLDFLPEWYFCHAGPYADRIILPVIFDHKYLGFQARTIHTVSSKKEIPITCWCGMVHIDIKRYMTSPGLLISKILFNYDKVPAPMCYVVEGIFNTLRFYNAVAAFSKNLSARQAELLASKYSTIILAFDLDATSDICKAGNLLFSFGCVVKVLPLIKKDPAEHTAEEISKLVPVDFSSWYSAKVQYKLFM